MHTIQALNDTLRNRNQKALALAEIHKTKELALQAERQSASILIRDIIIATIAIFLAICVIVMSSSSFYEQFKKRSGMSPSDFKARESSVSDIKV